MLVNSPDERFEQQNQAIPEKNTRKTPEKNQGDSNEKGYFLTAITPDKDTLVEMAKKHNISYEEFKEPKVHCKFLDDDLSRYVMFGMKADARATTINPLRNNVKAFLRYAKDAKVKHGKPKNQISKVSGTVTFSAVKEYNAYANTFASDTPLTDVRRFLTYIGKERGEPMLVTWAESLVYEQKGGGATFATEGEKAEIPKDGPQQDILAYYQYILNPAIGTVAKRQPFRNLVAILFGTTTGMRVKEFHRLTWQEINGYKEDQKVRLPNGKDASIPKGMIVLKGAKAKTGDTRAIPIHPAIIPYLELLEQIYDAPFHETQFIKARTTVNNAQPDNPAAYTFAQIRNWAAKYWRDYGIRAFYRLSIMGHDTDELKKEIEKGYIDTGELAETSGISSTYVGYSPAEILKEYQNTVGAKFNPIPKGIDLQKIKQALKL